MPFSIQCNRKLWSPEVTSLQVAPSLVLHRAERIHPSTFAVCSQAAGVPKCDADAEAVVTLGMTGRVCTPERPERKGHLKPQPEGMVSNKLHTSCYIPRRDPRPTRHAFNG